MNNVENKSIEAQIYLERYKNLEANKVVELLDYTNKEIVRFIKQTTDVSTKKRYTEIARKLRDVSKTLKDKAEKEIDVEGVIDYELKKQKSILGSIQKEIQKITGGTVNFLYPTKEQIKTSVLFKPIDSGTGMTYQSYLNSIQEGLYNTWDAAVRTGYLTGMPTKEIAEFVIGKVKSGIPMPGSINSFRNSVYSNTRTVIQSFANETAQRVYEENEQYFGDGKSDYKYEYLATLDSRTCLVCGNCDGKLYKSLKDAPIIPQHRGCRCFIIPYFDIEGDTRASKDGQIDKRITYDEWFEKQVASVKKDILGATRYKIYVSDSDKIDVSTFVDNGEKLSLPMLEDKLKKEIIEDIKKECSWYTAIPENIREDLLTDLKTVDTDHLRLIRDYARVDADYSVTGGQFIVDEYGNKKILVPLEKPNKRSIARGYKTNFCSFLHETGHAIDYSLGSEGYFSSELPDLKDVIEKDVINSCNKIKKTTYDSVSGILGDNEIVSEMNKQLKVNEDIKNGVSDIFDSITNHIIRNTYGHYEVGYWANEENVLAEAFANIMEARGSGGQVLEYMKEYFPETIRFLSRYI